MRASRSLHHPWVAPATTEQQFEALIRKATEPSFEALLACRRSDGAIVGFFKISQIIRGPLQSVFLGYGGVAGRWRDHERWAIRAEQWRSARTRARVTHSTTDRQMSLRPAAIGRLLHARSHSAVQVH